VGAVAVAVVVVFAILCVDEWWSRTRPAPSELHRKFVHITVGCFVASWPFFMSWAQIRLMSVAFLVVVLLSRRLRVFRAVRSVTRATWGDVFFAVAVGTTTLVTQDHWVYAAAIAEMALADGLAAVVGAAYGGRTRYRVLGHTKSVVGTATFVAVSVAVLLGYAVLSGRPSSAVLVLGLSCAAAAVENGGVLGLDNVLVPTLVAVVLQRLV
jgi:phytol kinase